jgi:D-sedoheptulose 7-phosphate isomerase
MAAFKADQAAVAASIEDSARTIEGLRAEAGRLAAIGETLVAALRSGGKVLTAGNGGSAAEALHMAEELVGRFKANRISLPAISLVADCTALTCIGNDYGYDEIFRRQVEGLGKAGDVLVLFSTSGSAENLRLALEEGKRKGLITVALLGRDGGKLAGQATHELIVRSRETARIQEAHQVVLHLLLEIVETAFV